MSQGNGRVAAGVVLAPRGDLSLPGSHSRKWKMMHGKSANSKPQEKSFSNRNSYRR